MLVTDDSTIQIYIDQDTRISKNNLGNPRIVDEDNLNYTDILGDKKIPNFLGESYFLKDFGIYSGSTVLLAPYAG